MILIHLAADGEENKNKKRKWKKQWKGKYNEQK